MVFVPTPSNVPKLNAYLTTSISAEDLAKIKSSFELGACSRICPLLELIIKDEPSYHGKSHGDIRRAEDAAGRTDAFVIIDERAVADDAVWYVDMFASVEDVADKVAESTSSVLQILMKIDCLALAWVNYDIGNMSILEDLDNCEVEFPISDEFEQERCYDCGGMDMIEQQRFQDTWITAEPGEFDVSTDENLRKNFMPKPEKVARLKADLALEHGLVATWTIPSTAKPAKLADGTEKTFAEGSVILQCTFDPDFPRPEYKWPEGSL